MSKAKSIEIDINSLLLDQNNFRIGRFNSQIDAIHAMISEQGEGLVNLAQHIAENGLSPNKSIMVVRHPTDKNFYVALDGNRRTTAIKIVLNPTLATGTSLEKKFNDLHKSHHRTMPRKLSCVELTEKEAEKWRRVDHYKDQKGVSQEMWSAIARERADKADGKRSAVLDALEFVLAGNAIPDDVRKIATGTDFEISTFERILNSVPAREQLGIDIKRKTIVAKRPKEWLLSALSEIVTAVARKKFENEKFAVKDVYTADAAGSFSKKVVKKIGATTKRAVSWTVNQDNSIQISTKTNKTRPPKAVTPEASWQRKTLIPASYPIKRFSQPKLNNLYRELKILNSHESPNACALIFRAILETSLKLYVDKNSIKIEGGKPTVKRQAKITLEYMKKNGLINDTTSRKLQSKLDGQPLAATCELNEYVHSKDFHPDGRTLNTAWDNLQPFFDIVWEDIK